MVGFLTDSPAFPLFFQTPSLFFSRCAELIDARKIHIIIKTKKHEINFRGEGGVRTPPKKKGRFGYFSAGGGEYPVPTETRSKRKELHPFPQGCMF